MNLSGILADLRGQRDQLSVAIACFERLAMGGAKRRGRPPAWLAKVKVAEAPAAVTAKKRGRPRKIQPSAA